MTPCAKRSHARAGFIRIRAGGAVGKGIDRVDPIEPESLISLERKQISGLGVSLELRLLCRGPDGSWRVTTVWRFCNFVGMETRSSSREIVIKTPSPVSTSRRRRSSCRCGARCGRDRHRLRREAP